MLKLPAFVRWTSRRSSALPADDSLEAFASERSFTPLPSAPTPARKPIVSVGRRSAAAGLLAFGVLPAMVIGVYALDWVKRPADRDSQTWNAGGTQPDSGAMQRVAFAAPAADRPATSRTTPLKTSGSTRPRRTRPTNRPPDPPRESLPVGVPVGLDAIQGPQVIGSTDTASARPANAASGRPLPREAVGEVYAAGKGAYEGGRYERARDSFQQAVGMIDSLPPDEQKALADLRLLAAGFVDLAAARIPPPTPIDKVPSLPAPRAVYVGPVAVQEEMPPWMPPSELPGRTEYVGVFRVRIGVDGRVTGSEVLDASHPAYDAQLMRSVSSWLYRPATRDGRPVPSVRDIQVRLVPR